MLEAKNCSAFGRSSIEQFHLVKTKKINGQIHALIRHTEQFQFQGKVINEIISWTINRIEIIQMELLRECRCTTDRQSKRANLM